MVEEKIIHYNDGMIIECMNESKSRVMIPHKMFKYCIENDINISNIFENRLIKDFNFVNIGGFYLKTEFTDKYTVFYFTRKVIPIK